MWHCPAAVRTALWQGRVQRSRMREVQLEGWEAARGGGDEGDDGDPGLTACVQWTAPWAWWRPSGGCWGLSWAPCRCSRAGTFQMLSWLCSRRETGNLLSPLCLPPARPGYRWWPGRRGRWVLLLERSWGSGPEWWHKYSIKQLNLISNYNLLLQYTIIAVQKKERNKEALDIIIFLSKWIFINLTFNHFCIF